MPHQPLHNNADDLACINVVELVTDYLEGALPAVEARRLERHLATCPGCTEYLEQLRAIAGSLRVVYGLSDTENAVTQGPVWRLAGKSV